MCYWTHIILVNFYLNIPLSFNESFLPHIGWLLWYSPHPAGLPAPYKVQYIKNDLDNKKVQQSKKREKKTKIKNKLQYKYFLFPLLYLQV